ncbi:MAG: heme-copper oxidase subunit III, partial [Akkermansiaceae bacterium]|nr:heme-copper oxidase subunit III [Akkermansiaceae bacterium]
MEIPYTVTARKDTGLFNSKVGIWLFLASEVMLFGGLFSGYIFLRIYADYPWPERTLPVLPGLINTFVLIGSSVTVVFAWAALKMRQWRRFQVFMGITIACAAIFMVLKGIEYTAKWGHQAVRMDDYAIVEGHTHKAELDDHGHFHVIHGKKYPDHAFPANRIVFETNEIQIDLTRFYAPYMKELIEQAEERGSKILLADTIAGKRNPKADEKTVAMAGEELAVGFLKDARELFLDARAHNAGVRTDELRRLWRVAKKNNPG